MRVDSLFPEAMENDAKIVDYLKNCSPTESVNDEQRNAYLCPPGNQGDVTSFLYDIGLREWDGVGLHRNLLHWGNTDTHIHRQLLASSTRPHSCEHITSIFIH